MGDDFGGHSHDLRWHSSRTRELTLKHLLDADRHEGLHTMCTAGRVCCDGARLRYRYVVEGLFRGTKGARQ